MSLEEAAEESPTTSGAEVEARLWRELKNDGSATAREQLFNAYFTLAQRIARRHFIDRKSGDIELSDLSQLAAQGLLEAIDRYEPSLGAPFRAFAARRISGSILSGIPKLSERREQAHHRRRVNRERLRSLESEAAAPRDALDALTELAVGLAIGFMLDDAALSVTENVTEPSYSAYDSLAWKETLARVTAELARLPERERVIIEHHYSHGLTFEQISAMLDLSKGRISQLHRAALERLRKRLGRAERFRLER